MYSSSWYDGYLLVSHQEQDTLRYLLLAIDEVCRLGSESSSNYSATQDNSLHIEITNEAHNLDDQVLILRYINLLTCYTMNIQRISSPLSMCVIKTTYATSLKLGFRFSETQPCVPPPLPNPDKSRLFVLVYNMFEYNTLVIAYQHFFRKLFS